MEAEAVEATEEVAGCEEERKEEEMRCLVK